MNMDKFISSTRITDDQFNKLLHDIGYCNTFNVSKGIRKTMYMSYEICMIRIDYDYPFIAPAYAGSYDLIYNTGSHIHMNCGVSVEYTENNDKKILDRVYFNIDNTDQISELFTALEDKSGMILL